MSNPPVQTVSTSADKVKLAAVGVLAVGGVVAFYVLGQREMWMRLGALLGFLALACTVFLMSEPGRRLVVYAGDSIREVGKVVWPTRKEAGQMTLYVFIFVMIMALFLFATDKTLEWVIYHVLLGWK